MVLVSVTEGFGVDLVVVGISLQSICSRSVLGFSD